MNDNLQEKILTKCIEVAKISRLSEKTLEEACESIGIDKNTHKLFFEDGIKSVIESIFSSINEQMLSKMSEIDFQSLKIRQRIKLGVLIKLEVLNEQKDLMLKIFEYLMHPKNIVFGLKLISKSADLIWSYAGLDNSTDFNFYSKRIILSGVIVTTLKYWMTHSKEEVEQFLDHRLTEVLKFGSFIRKFKR